MSNTAPRLCAMMLAPLLAFAPLTARAADVGSARATDVGSADEAVTLVKKALAHMKSVGKDKACADFAASPGEYQLKDLYVFVQDTDGLMICHGKNAALNGKNLMGLKDSDGKTFVAQFVDTIKTKGSGWVDYKWVNAATKKIEPKSSYVEKGEGNTWIGAGIYKP